MFKTGRFGAFFHFDFKKLHAAVRKSHVQVQMFKTDGVGTFLSKKDAAVHAVVTKVTWPSQNVKFRCLKLTVTSSPVDQSVN